MIIRMLPSAAWMQATEPSLHLCCAKAQTFDLLYFVGRPHTGAMAAVACIALQRTLRCEHLVSAGVSCRPSRGTSPTLYCIQRKSGFHAPVSRSHRHVEKQYSQSLLTLTVQWVVG